MKKLMSYLLLIPLAIRANYLRAYRQSKAQKRFIFKTKQPEFFKTKIKAIADANHKATITETTWHVIEPVQDKFVAVSNKFFVGSGFKSLHQAN
jgi:hypothetical protein